MQFAKIERLSDVVEYVGDGAQFGLFEREDGTTVIKYNYVDATTFTIGDEIERSIRREFRGITFDTETGLILSRPYHKFFNLGENQDSRVEDNLDIADSVILEKLDGSMIHVFQHNASLIYATKAGTTDTSIKVKEWVKADYNRMTNYEDFIYSTILRGFTPIFEWLDHRVPIVIDYEESNLVLTAMRHRITGDYLDYENMKFFASAWNIPVVRAVKVFSFDSIKDVMSYAETMEGAEGFVVRKNAGDMLKVKAQWYVFLHKNREGILKERHVLEAILNETIDDILPFVTESDRQAVDKYRTQIFAEISRVSMEIAMRLEARLVQYLDPVEGSYNRKQMGLDKALNEFGHFMNVGFRALPGEDLVWSIEQKLTNLLTQSCLKDINLHSLKSELGIEANYETF